MKGLIQMLRYYFRPRYTTSEFEKERRESLNRVVISEAVDQVLRERLDRLELLEREADVVTREFPHRARGDRF